MAPCQRCEGHRRSVKAAARICKRLKRLGSNWSTGLRRTLGLRCLVCQLETLSLKANFRKPFSRIRPSRLYRAGHEREQSSCAVAVDNVEQTGTLTIG